jgi:hypothetical protein
VVVKGFGIDASSPTRHKLPALDFSLTRLSLVGERTLLVKSANTCFPSVDLLHFANVLKTAPSQTVFQTVFEFLHESRKVRNSMYNSFFLEQPFNQKLSPFLHSPCKKNDAAGITSSRPLASSLPKPKSFFDLVLLAFYDLLNPLWTSFNRSLSLPNQSAHQTGQFHRPALPFPPSLI